jgi:signal transduction histidine kinase
MRKTGAANLRMLAALFEKRHPHGNGLRARKPPRVFADVILRQAPVGLVVTDTRGAVTLANNAARRLAQAAPAGGRRVLTPGMWGVLVHLSGTRVPVSEWPARRALRGETILDEEYCFAQTGDRSRIVSISAMPITIKGNIIGAVTVLTDITQRKHAEKLSREEAVNNERVRLAADIHDTFTQDLSALELQLRMIAGELPRGASRAAPFLQRAQEIAHASLAEARRSISTLSNGSIPAEDLGQALSSLAKKIFGGVPMKLELILQQKEKGRLAAETRGELLQIGREAMVNVLKHAKATRIHIDLIYRKRQVQLRINDDGQGFQPAQPRGADGGFGLTGMRKRAERLSGTFAVDSQPGRGTRLTVLMPLLSIH